MSPFLSYSGRGGSHRGRGRAGRGGVGRGRGWAGRGNSIDRRANVNKHKWVRPTVSNKAQQSVGNDGQEESALKILQESDSFPDSTQAGNDSKCENEKEKSLPIQECSHRIMKRNGQHALILSSKTKNRSVASVVASGDSLSETEPQSQRQPPTKGQTLTRAGRNKLVSLSTSNTAKPMEQKQRMNSYLIDRKHKGLRGHHKVAPASTLLRPTAKRVKLSVLQHSSMMDKDNNAGSNNVQEKDDSTDQLLLSNNQAAATGIYTSSNAKPAEKLSDFAYRETSRVRQRETISGRSLRWCKKSSGESSSEDTISDKNSLEFPTIAGNLNRRRKIKNMGLVRVQPDEKTTPICPTFLRGLDCQDPFCRKRHDIPKEYAMPVCSFFQHHGQCLKGESCVFRHIKLNANALVCPSFAILGFCEDEQCTMQHLRGQTAKTAIGEYGTCTLATDKSSSRFRRKPNNVYYRNKSASGGRAKDTKP